MGNHIGLSAGCKLYGKNDTYDGSYLMGPTHKVEDTKIISGDIIINNFASIGADSILLPGSIIPKGTILGAKSLYTGKYSLRR